MAEAPGNWSKSTNVASDVTGRSQRLLTVAPGAASVGPDRVQFDWPFDEFVDRERQPRKEVYLGRGRKCCLGERRFRGR